MSEGKQELWRIEWCLHCYCLILSGLNSWLILNLKFVTWSFSDPRTKDWPLVQSPWPTYISCFIYIVSSWKIGPYLMRNREPFQLKYVLVVYNTLLLYLNYHITKEVRPYFRIDLPLLSLALSSLGNIQRISNIDWIKLQVNLESSFQKPKHGSKIN